MAEMREGEFTSEERRLHEFPRCPVCGGRTIGSWVKVSALGDVDDRWMPGTYRCAMPNRH